MEPAIIIRFLSKEKAIILDEYVALPTFHLSFLLNNLRASNNVYWKNFREILTMRFRDSISSQYSEDLSLNVLQNMKF